MGLPQSLGLFNLSQTAFSLTNLWVFYLFPSPPQLNLSSFDSAAGSLVGFAKSSISVLTLAQLCQKVNLPFQAFETANHPATNVKYVENAPPLESITIEYLETREHFVQRYWLDQQNKMYDARRKIHKTGNHKLEGYLIVFPAGSPTQDAVAAVQGALGGIGGLAAAQGAQVVDNILDNVPAGIYHYEGLLYKGMQALENQYEDGDIRRIQVSFEVDRITREDENIPGLNDVVNAL